MNPLQDRYGAYLTGLAEQMRRIADSVAEISTGEDLNNLGRKLELCKELSSVLAAQWQMTAIAFGESGEILEDDECPFHFTDFHPLTCAGCRTALNAEVFVMAGRP